MKRIQWKRLVMTDKFEDCQSLIQRLLWLRGHSPILYSVAIALIKGMREMRIAFSRPLSEEQKRALKQIIGRE